MIKVNIPTYSDYYPFGMVMPGRNGGGFYRHSFNGMEKDDEISGNGNSLTTPFRMYNPRLGRWMSTDPITHPYFSPYNAFDNNPIYFADPSGADSEKRARKYAKKNGIEKYEVNKVNGNSHLTWTEDGTAVAKLFKQNGWEKFSSGVMNFEQNFTNWMRPKMGSGTEWNEFNKTLAINVAEVMPLVGATIGADKAISGIDKARGEAVGGGTRAFEGSMAALDLFGVGWLGRIGKTGKTLNYVEKLADVAPIGTNSVLRLTNNVVSLLSPLGRGSTGRTIAKNLTEKLAMKEIISNPNTGKTLIKKMKDASGRWDGWSKMSNKTAHGIEIHFNALKENGVIKAIDDFKFISN